MRSPWNDWKSDKGTLPISDVRLESLKAISNPPNRIFFIGNPEVLGTRHFSVVGTRNPSRMGLSAAFSFSKNLVGCGFTIVSGLARGIDAMAHRGALASGGKTVAVLGHGLDRIYPPEHLDLAKKIVDLGGALISEFPIGVPPLRENFPKRNRIIAGLAVGVLVIEAAQKSGSLITAKFAADEGREVFVVPGSFEDLGFCGSHSLIQQGAKLVTGTKDILEDFPEWMRPIHLEDEQFETLTLEELIDRKGNDIHFHEWLESKIQTREIQPLGLRGFLVSTRCISRVAPVTIK